MKVQNNEARALRAALDAIDSGDSNKAREALKALDGPGPQGAQRVLAKIANGNPVPPPIGRPARAAIVARLAELDPVEEKPVAHHPLVRVEPDCDPKPANELAAVEPIEDRAVDRIADALDGVEILSGDDAVRATRALVCEAEHGAPIVDAAELAARLAAAPDGRARDRIALDPAVLHAAAALEHMGDHAGAAELRRVVKDAKVSAKAWDAGTRDALAAILAAEADRADDAARKAAALRREADDAARDAKAAEIERRRREAGEDLGCYVSEFGAAGGITFAMERGVMTATVPTERPDGTPGRPKVRHLMNAAARIVAVIEEQEQPGAQPVVLFRVGFALNKGAPLAVDIPSANFNGCAWITPETGGRVVLSPGRDVADLVRVGINASREDAPTTHRRAFLGWVHDAGRWMRLHAGGAIDAGGAVVGAEVRVPGKLARYTLPAPPVGAERLDALDALRELATMEPAGAVLPVLAFVVRALIGPGAGVCHLHGRATLGKSHLAALALCLAGDFDGPKSLPGEWERDTANYTAKVLSIAGDTPWALDDWRPAWDPTGQRFHDVARATFNGSGRGALSRARGFNETADPRGSALSTGEALPTGGAWSGLSRVLAVELSERVTLPGGVYAPQGDDEDPERAFTVRAPEHLSRAGALLVQWLASRLDAWRDPDALASRKRLVAAERTALARWGVRESARAVDVLGPVALGAEVLHAFMRDSDAMDARALAHLDARVRDALAGLAGDRRDTLAELAPGRAFVDALAALMREGACHAVAVIANKVAPTHPTPSAHAFGWRLRNGSWEPAGRTVAHLDTRHPGALCLDPAAALAAVSEGARRAGRSAEILTPEHLARELTAAGLLDARESAKRASVRERVDGASVSRLVVKLAAFGFGPDDTDTDTDTDAA